jgi:hypothetical protein
MQSIISTQFTPDELTELIRLAVSEAITAFVPYPTLPTEPRYLSRKETAARLTLKTLWDRTRRGDITAHRFGNRVLYKLEDVEAALSKVRTTLNR